MEFEELNPLLHNELRLKVMVALDALDAADFVYLKNLTKATAGNLSVQITKLEEAGYIRVSRSGEGRGSHTVCRITSAGISALLEYQKALLSYFRRSSD
jgi:DNA-binding MarR family transcriptional regulator